MAKENVFKRFRKYLHDVRIELKKVVWPNRQEVIASTLVVVVTLVFFAGYTAILDAVFSQAITFITARV